MHYLCVGLRKTIMQSHTHTMQQTHTHKAVTGSIEAKKLLSHQRQSRSIIHHRKMKTCMFHLKCICPWVYIPGVLNQGFQHCIMEGHNQTIKCTLKSQIHLFLYVSFFKFFEVFKHQSPLLQAPFLANAPPVEKPCPTLHNLFFSLWIPT